MEVKRQGEIAFLLLKHRIRREGATISQNDARELGDTAKAIGVPLEELKEFVRPLLHDLVDEFLSTKK
ncbi:MAG TPA: hypothetical protein VJB95_01940 [Candidatus Paceibacterota bacterium]